MKKYILVILSLAFMSSAFALIVKNEKVILEKLEDYNECQSRSYEGNICDTSLRDWTKAHPADSFKAGKMTRMKMNAWGAIYFFDKAFDAKKEDCADKDLWMAIASAAALPESYKEPIAGMKKIAFKHCFKEMKADVMELAAVGAYEKANLCPEFKAKKVDVAACK